MGGGAVGRVGWGRGCRWGNLGWWWGGWHKALVGCWDFLETYCSGSNMPAKGPL